MANTKKTGLAVFAVLLLLVSLTVFALTTFTEDFSTYSVIYCIWEAAFCITAFIYILSGFAKKYALCYKIYFIAMAVSYMFKLLFAFFHGRSSNDWEFIVNLIGYGAIVVLAFSTDLGRKKSLFAVSVPLVLFSATTLVFALMFLLYPKVDAHLFSALEYLCTVPPGLLTLMMVYGKFTDKSIRKGEKADK